MSEIEFNTVQYEYCTNCGAQNIKGNNFCGKCGSRLENMQSQEQFLYNDFKKYIEVKAEYYLPKFQTFKLSHKQTSWNWCAFFFSAYWFIYRKMYGYAAILIGTHCLLNFMMWLNLTSLFVWTVSLVEMIILGIFGNYIYMRHLEKRMEQEKSLTGELKNVFVKRNAGVNTLAVVILIVVDLILELII